MHPILFEVGGITLFSYGFMIALGSIAGVTYMAVQGKKEVGLSFDQANALFLCIFAAAFVGGKVFLFFEDTSYYLKYPLKLVTGRGFVFYGSFLFTIPTMLWFFKKHKLHTYKMLDVMAVTTCLVHIFGRLGCFLAGCCHGRPTDSSIGITFTDAACYADPLNTPLIPSQLMEATYIFIIMMILLFIRKRTKFYGQLFLLYIILYAIGRSVLEIYRGDSARGFIIEDYLSHSQFIALILLGAGIYIYTLLARRNRIAGLK
ncbi:MAG TPA: prolipoprotein diacylglyceryl transferase [Chryseolinea sp.]|jgi:phosphatidylglycerol:prolipoprotein diacylglycerol transferase|nr:prolipoprotein diacylglyceryl transferase [Chryseolinea sp.]